MEILGFNRVELVVRDDQIEEAVQQFNDLLGTHLPKPHVIQGHGHLSSTDFDGAIEFVAPVGAEGAFAAKLAQHGPGQIGPLVWEVSEIEASRTWLEERGFRIVYEYDSSKGNADEAAAAVHQLVLDPEQWFGFSVTLMQRKGS
jgi:hypothetical protein